MLTPDQVIPFLMHEDYFVRGHALRYLAAAEEQAGITGDDLWRMVDRFGHSDRHSELHELSKLPATEASLERILQELRKKDEEVEYPLLNAVRGCDLNLLSRLRERVVSEPAIDAETLAHIAERLELLDHPVEPQVLWEKLLAVAKEADTTYLDQPSGIECARRADRLLEALARHPDYAAATISPIIAEAPEEEYARPAYAIRLAGLIHCDSLVEPLVGLLHWDFEDLSSDAANALVRINQPRIVSLVADRYVFDGDERLDACYPVMEVLRRIRRPEVENRLIEFFHREEDDELRTDLADCLCGLCTTDGKVLAGIRDFILSGNYVRQVAHLPEDMLPVSIMVAFNPPELDEWRKQADDSRQRLRKSLAEFRKSEEEYDLFDDEEPEASKAFGPYVPPLPLEFDDNPAPTGTIRRSEPKIGRNDPCPCGSGKKHKKCCGK